MNTIAPSGATNDQTITALAFTNPPSVHWRSTGRTSIKPILHDPEDVVPLGPRQEDEARDGRELVRERDGRGERATEREVGERPAVARTPTWRW